METKNIHEIIEFLKSNGITLFVKEDQLGIKRKKGSVLSDDILETIKSNKAQLITVLSRQKNQSRNKIKTASDYGLPVSVTNKELSDFLKLPAHQGNISDIYALTPLQEGLLFHSLYEENTSAYIVQFQCDLVGTFSKTSFDKAWTYLLEKHTILRTAIFTEALDLPVQCVYDGVQMPVTEIDYSTLSEDAKNNEVETFLENDRTSGFDLDKAPLFRITLLNLGDNRTRLVFTNHHILWDGWSFSSLMGSFMTCYTQLETDGTLPKVAFDDYGAHIRRISGNNDSIGLAYWKNYLSEVSSPTYFPFINDVTKRNKIFGNTDDLLVLPKEFSDEISTFAEQNRITVNTLLQGVWSLLLSKYTANETVVFGATVSGRDSEVKGIEEKVGLYINTIPVCSQVNQEAKISDWLQKIQKEHTEAREEHSYLPLSSVESQSTINGSLFDSILVFENYPVEEILAESKSSFEIENVEETESTNYTLAISAAQSGSGLAINFMYNDTIIDSKTIATIKNHMQVLLKSFLDDTVYVGDLNYLTEVEHIELLDLFNTTAVEYPQQETITSLFEKQVLKSPNAIATVYEGQKLTYKQLDEKSNQLANYLREKGVKDETFVPICVERSLNMIVGILAIIKAGGVYVPVDPNYPQERVDFILNDLQAEIVVTENAFAEFFSEKIHTVQLDTLAETLETYPTGKTENTVSSSQLLYVIYTSGTTGTPKGVLITHENVVRLFYNENSLFNFNEKDVWSMFHSYNFDFSVWEMYGALLFGGKLVVVPSSYTKDPELFGSLLANEGVTILNQTPSAFNVLQERVIQNKLDLKVRYVIFGGEALHPQIVKNWKANYSDCKLINMYGITETTVHVTYKEITDKEIESNQSNIGVPIPTLGCVILDDSQELVPIGVQGELYITGAGLARGYLNRKELTEERFVTLNLGNEEKRYYRSGDLAKINTEGELEYLGRKDDQVKIRGYRIELGEIEAALEQLSNIKQSVVLAREDVSGNKQLVAYVVTNEGFDQKVIQEELITKLPEYMVPKLYVSLPEFPLTSNGKIDKKNLPSPASDDYKTANYVAPRTEIEKQLAEIWEEQLELPQVGIYDDFFELGGDSIKIIRLISVLNKQYETKIGLAKFYQNPTITNLVTLISGEEKTVDETTAARLIIEKELEDIKLSVLNSHPEKELIENAYPMSDIQVGMVLTSEMMRSDGEDGIYHDQMVSQVGVLNIPVMEKALNLLIEKHEILRTSFHLYEFSQPIQIVHKAKNNAIVIEDISGKTKEEREQYIKDFLAKERTDNPFDVTNAPLWRIHIFQVDDSDSVFVFQFHHAIIDGWSDKSFRSELMQTYLELQKNENHKPSKLAIGLKESVISDLLELKNEDNSNYWKEKLQDYKRLDILSNERQYHETGIIFRQDFYERIVAKCKEDHITPKSLFFAGYVYTLSLFSLEKDITVGTVSHRRPIAEDGDKLLGCFLNTVPFRFNTESIGDDSWLSYIRQVETDLQTLKGKDRFSLIEISKLHKESSRNNPFFDVMFNYVDFHVIDNLMENKEFETHANQKETTELAVGDFERTNTFLDVTVSLTGNELTISASQTKKLKSGHSLENVIDYFHNFLDNYLENAEAKVDSRAILLEEEQTQLLETFNNTSVSYEEGKTVLDVLANQVEKNPSATAIIFEETTLSYQELDKKSNQLANYLAKQDIQAESFIPLCLNRSVEMIIAIFGVLKAGHAYVPIDPTNPQSRIDFILQDISAEIVLTESSLENLFSEGTQTVLSLDQLTIEDESATFEANVNENQLAYTIYTSGTTGTPKGVMIEHKSLFNFLNGFSELYNFTDKARIGFKTNYAFDVSVHEIFGWIKDGGSLVILPKDAEKDGTGIIESIQQHKITHLNLVPSLFSVLLEELQNTNKEVLSSLEYFFLAGEALPLQLVKDYHKLAFEAKLENIYGPTEATIYSSYFSTENLTEDQTSIPIGKPTINTQLYILDNELSLVPTGVVGELCISGKGLSKGYLNREELTQEKFVDHPFKENEKLYKTGDLAKWLPDGNIEYLGRKDDQVKIRGYRIELGEIETALDQLSNIKQSVVIAKDDTTGSKQLVTYFVSETEVEFSKIQEQLTSQLPSYMIPGRYMRLEEFPLNANGKINKKELPELDITDLKTTVFTAPTTEVEKQLVSIWEELLGVEQIGVDDNFFQLGGDSIKAIQLVSRSKMIDIHYQVRDIFTHQTIAQIALHVKEASTLIQETGILEGEVVLHPIQKQFFEKENEAYNHYNQSVLLTVSKTITEEHLAEAITLLSNQHDALRLQYQLNEEVIQSYGKHELTLQVETVGSTDEISETCTKTQTTLDIEKGDVARFIWIQTPKTEKENRVFVGIHHLAIDGISWRVLLEDFTKILENQQQGITVSLPEKGTSYRQWTNALQEYANATTLEKETEYWKQVLENHKSLPVDLTYDKPITFQETKNYSVSLDESATKLLLQEVNNAYGTEINDVLLSALAMALKSWMNAPKVVIGLEGHGREELFDNIDINRTIGWFTSLYPVCLDLQNTSDLGVLLADTKDMLREIPNKGIGYSVLRYLSEKEEIKSELSVAYEDIIFNYLGSFDNSVSSDKESIIGFAKESAGETMSPKNKYSHKFSINSMIVEGCLQLDWDYDSKRYTEETVKQLADNYIKALQTIITHCKTIDAPIKTVSDYKLPATINNSQLTDFIASEKHQRDVLDIYPLSPLQEGFLFHSLYDEDTSSYIIQFQCDIISDFSEDSFRKTWKHLIAQHTILRTAMFTEELAIPVQCVYNEVEPPITNIDYSNLSGKDLEKAVETYIENDRTAGFVLENAPLFRISLLNIGNNRTRMVFTNHHMLWDGWSLSRLMSSFMSCYSQLETDGTLPELPFDNYGAHIRHISGMNEIKGENYWKNYLADINSPSYLPFIKDEAKRNKIFGNTEHDFTFSGDIQTFTEKHHITMNTLIQGAWSYLLSKYTNEETVVFGATISGRDSGIENVEDKVGLYINTIPVASTIKNDTKVSNWLQELQKEHTVGRETYGFMSLNTVEAQSDISGSLFDSIVVFENYPVEEISSESSAKFMIENAQGVERNNYTLSLSVFPVKEGVTIRFGYNDGVISDETIKMIKGHLDTILESFLNDVEHIGDLDYLREEEKKQILRDFSTINATYPKEENVVSLFEEQVEKTPNAIAVVYDDVQLTYKELNEKANQVAYYLKESYNITNNDFVGIMMKRSDWMLVSMLGILKSGATYVPIDSNYPMSRKSFMIEDTNIKALLIASEDLFEVMELNVNLCSVDIEYATMVADMPYSENLQIERKPSDLAYVIYTSGTSGKAKGSLIPDEAIVRLANMTQLPLNEDTRILQLASVSFDAATFEIWCSLLNGGQLVVYPHHEIDLELINDTIQKYKVNTTWFTSGLLDQWVESDITELPLKYMLCGGDVLTPSSITLLYNKLPEITIINGYGPTENTTFTACHRIPKDFETEKSIPIGYPITGTSIYILDDNLQIVPIGVAGELCTGGAGLSKGYLNQPELTQEKFIKNPFQKGTHLYKTGDLVKWLPNGSIEFIGRKDNQVKIRGYRIELGEIETALEGVEEVKQSVVLALDDEQGGKQLVAYTVSDVSLDGKYLQTKLETNLPEYMIPKAYVNLTQFPLTTNGKVDRKALPAPSVEAYQTEAYKAPSTEQEIQLAEIWQDLLGIEQIGVEDNFFELGGDSIKAIQLVSRSKSSGLFYSVKDIFQYQTILEIAKRLKTGDTVIKESGVLEEEVLLHPIQKQFFEHDYAEFNHYNQSVLLTIPKTVSQATLENAIVKIDKHHDALRFNYKKVENSNYPTQKYGTQEATLKIETVAGVDEITTICDKYQADLDIYNGDITRFVWIKTPESEEKNRIFIGIHHLAVDGVSWRIILEDLTNLVENENASLPAKGTSYRQWTTELQKYADKIAITEEHSYWKKVLANYEALPVDIEYAENITNNETASYSISIAKEKTQVLLQEVNSAYGTEVNDVLLTALAVAMQEYVTGSNLVIAMEGHGREELFEGIDINRTVGWFTSMYPVCLQLNKTAEIGTLLADTKDMLRRIPTKGLGYGVLRYSATSAEVQQELAVAYEDIIFNYLGSFDNSVSNEKEGLIGFADESAGETTGKNNTNPHKLSINSMVVKGELQIDWNYDGKRYHEATIKEFAERYINAIDAIIAHCTTISNKVKTANDLGLPTEISNAELVAFQNLEIHQNEIEDIYPLSPLQEGLLFHSLYNNNTAAYIVQFQCDIVGEFSKTSFEKAWKHLMEAHTILRTGIHTKNISIPIQCVYKNIEVPLATIDYSDLTAEEQSKAIEKFVFEDRNIGFSLQEAPLFRITLINTGNGHTKMVFTNHHMLWDGWSLSRLMENFMTSYTQLEENKELPLVSIDNYGSHIRHITSKNEGRGKSYWKSYLANITEPSYLPFIKDGSKRNKVFGNIEREFVLTLDLNDKIYAYAEKQRITVNTLLQASWAYLLSKYTQQNEVVFGATISGRDSDVEGIDDKIGLYINTIPVTSTIEASEKVSTWLQNLQNEHTEAREEFAYLPLSTVEGQSNIKGSLFDSLVVFENYPVEEISSETSTSEEHSGFGLENVKGKESTNYALSLIILPAKEGLTIRFGYNDALITEGAIAMIELHIEQLLESFLTAENISDLNYLTEKEKTQLLEEFNTTAVEYPHEETVVSLFEAQVAKTPNAVALLFEEKEVSYKELDSASNQVANYLISKGITTNSLVPICIERSLEMHIGILGILKAGGAYVPIDTNNPVERIDFIVNDINAEIILTSATLSEVFAKTEKELFYLDQLDENLSAKAVEVNITPSQLAYAIYTSGTTGLPKGVKNAHSGLLNRLLWMQEDVNISNESVLIQKTPYVFDVSVWEILMPLVSGCKLVIAKPEGHKDPIYLEETIEKHGVNLIHFVPSMLAVFIETVTAEKCKSLQNIVCSGEALPVQMVRDFKSKFTSIGIRNYYGPTEAAIDVTAIDLTDKDYEVTIPIGKPVANTSIYIVGDDMKLSPIGVSGELLIGGVQVSEGYINREELTKEKFIASPFKEGERLYKTGDIARWLSDGNIEYLGRKDDQIKLRGYRIELGEITAALDQIEGIKQSLVVVREDKGSKQLVAYIVSEEEIDTKAIQAALSTQLPEYMIPKMYMQLESFPLTTNGKVNRKALPVPADADYQTTEYVAPSNEVEQQIAGVWEEQLEIERVGIHDNFFELGGDSIKIIRLISVINKQYDTNIAIASFYQSPTIENLAKLIKSENKEDQASVYLAIEQEIEATALSVRNNHPNQEEIENVYPMSDIQVGMVLTSEMMRLDGELGIYHDQMVSQIGKVDIALMEKALQLMVQKHETLRTSFHLYDYENPVQIIHKNIEIDIKVKDISGKTDEEKQDAINAFLVEEREQNPFEVTEAPLWRVHIFEMSDTDAMFIYQFHHAIMDGWSDKSFRSELMETYLTLEKDASYQPSSLAIGIKESVVSDMLELRNEENIAYWTDRLKDHKRLDILSEERHYYQSNKMYTKDFYEEILEKCKKDRITPKTVFFAGYLYVLSLFSYEKDMTVGTVAHRRPIAEDGDKLLGCFLNTSPFRFNMEHVHTKTWMEYITSVNGALQELKRKDRYSLLEIAKQHQESAEQNPFFDILFNYVDFHVVDELIESEAFESHLSQMQVGDLSVNGFERTNTFLEFIVNVTGEEMMISFSQSRAFKSGHTLEDIFVYFDNFLQHYLHNENEQTDHNVILSKEEQLAIVETCNATEVSYDKETVLTLFTKQAQANPEEIAVDFNGIELTYKELDEQSNQLANCLRSEYNIEKGNHIGIHLDRSETYILTILGILKAGCVYVPIDTTYPVSRKQYILENAEIDLLISDTNYMFELDYFKGTLFALDVEFDANQFDATRNTQVDILDTAYIIYTSGSTGKPKGTPITHDSLTNYLQSVRNSYIGKENQADFGLFTSPSFDLTITSIFLPLVTGGMITVFDEAQDTIATLYDYIESGISCIKMTPSHVSLLKEVDIQSDELQVAILGGEELKATHVEILKEINPDIKIFNEYGPTEATVGCMVDEIITSENITIGSPIANTKIYIVDTNTNLVPIGVPGELCISGKGLSKGYLNALELTQEKFIKNPFEKGKRLYKTGDLAKRLADGKVQYLGRIDDQLKIRGYRIELGEIENTINTLPTITESVVIAIDDQTDGKQLISYVVASEEIDNKVIQTLLEEKLPDYMIPKLYMQLESIPLTTNGKVDKKALPAIDDSAYQTVEYVAPTTPIEIQLVEIWQELLGIAQIGVLDNFFELGGHSLLAVRMVSRINKDLSMKLDIRTMFEMTNISLLATHISLNKSNVKDETKTYRQIEL